MVQYIMDSESYRIAGFELGHMVFIFILLGCVLFVIYWLWVYPCDGHETAEKERVTRRGSSPGRVISPPEVTSLSLKEAGNGAILYALEIEPGTVVLQSPDGDLFRVLREFDSIANNGSPTSGLPLGTSVPVHYIPAYTRAHVQNRPSAPPHPALTGGQPYTSLDDPWRPLSIQSGSAH